MISHRLVPQIEAHTVERSRAHAMPDETSGTVWGTTSAFSIVNPPQPGVGGADPYDPEAIAQTDENGGFVVKLWPDHIYTERTHRLSPVWRKFNVARIEAENAPETYIDVAVTTELLFPIRSMVMKYTGGGSYVEDTQGLQYEERLIHSYVHLKLPSPAADWEIIQYGVEEGVWPQYSDEMFSPGAFTPTSSWQTHFGSGTWSR